LCCQGKENEWKNRSSWKMSRNLAIANRVCRETLFILYLKKRQPPFLRSVPRRIGKSSPIIKTVPARPQFILCNLFRFALLWSGGSAVRDMPWT
jgi:hypothetical protein